MHGVFLELSLVLIVTTVVSIVMKLLRQPLILGYILAGLLVGPAALKLIHSVGTFDSFSSIGIALLLFIIGLGMNISELRKLGKAVVIAALSSLLSVGLIGYITGSVLGYNHTEAIIVGLALFFSSTIIIVKILSDQKEQNRLYGQIAIGVIVLDDFVATLALLFIAANKHGGVAPQALLLLGIKAIALGTFLFIANTRFLKKLTHAMASSQELLFLFAIAWGFGVASLFEMAGFSIEVGALFAGVALASLPYAQEIASRLKPLRDFFVVLFFITLGQSLNVSNLSAGIIPALLLSLTVIVIKPVVTTLSLSLLGYTKRISFMAGIHLSQISEFSIILVVLATTSGVIRPEISAIITMVAIITIAISTYLMKYDAELFTWFDRFKFKVFEKDATHKERATSSHFQLILFGYHKGGREFIKTFQHSNKPFLIVDYDPTVIDMLDRNGIPNLYGDATDLELLDEVGVEHAKLLVSLLGNFELNKTFIAQLEARNPHAVIIARADTIKQATELYELGASYVMMPHYIGSEKLNNFISTHGFKKQEFAKYREKHLNQLEAYYSAGEL